MPATIAGSHLGPDTHANRPAANAAGQPIGALYSCTTHSLIYKTDGSSWSTYASLTGTGLADPMTTRGDMIFRNASNVTDRLALPAAGQVIGRVGSDLGALYPPGYEFDYAEITAPVTVTATAEGSANTVVSGNPVTYSGTDMVDVEFYAPFAQSDTSAAGDNLVICLIDSVGPTNLGRMALIQTVVTATRARMPVYLSRRLTPSAAAHTYSIAAWASANANASIEAGAGGNGNSMPAFIRIRKK